MSVLELPMSTFINMTIILFLNKIIVYNLIINYKVKLKKVYEKL